MPKTGTSAVQSAFHRHVSPGFEAADLGSANHSVPLILLFEDPDRVAEHHAFWPRGAGFLAGIPERRRALRRRFERQMKRLRGTDTTILISAEALWASRRGGLREGLAAALAAHGAEVEVLCYIRPPLSYAASAFQQRLKSHKATGALDLHRLWPGYRRSVEHLDAVFGESKVRLRLYRRDALRGGDIVEDVAEVLGIPVPQPADASRLRPNLSLGAEAAAFLYAARRRGLRLPDGYGEALQDMRALIAGLRRVGSRPLTFAASAWDPVIDAHRAGLGWIEVRLGQSLAESRDPEAFQVASEEDLLRLADEVAKHEAAQAFLEGVRVAHDRGGLREHRQPRNSVPEPRAWPAWPSSGREVEP